MRCDPIRLGRRAPENAVRTLARAAAVMRLRVTLHEAAHLVMALVVEPGLAVIVGFAGRRRQETEIDRAEIAGMMWIVASGDQWRERKRHLATDVGRRLVHCLPGTDLVETVRRLEPTLQLWRHAEADNPFVEPCPFGCEQGERAGALFLRRLDTGAGDDAAERSRRAEFHPFPLLHGLVELAERRPGAGKAIEDAAHLAQRAGRNSRHAAADHEARFADVGPRRAGKSRRIAVQLTDDEIEPPVRIEEDLARVGAVGHVLKIREPDRLAGARPQ